MVEPRVDDELEQPIRVGEPTREHEHRERERPTTAQPRTFWARPAPIRVAVHIRTSLEPRTDNHGIDRTPANLAAVTLPSPTARVCAAAPLALLLAATLVGCGSSGGGADSPTTEQAAIPVSAVRVTLLDPGTGPHTVLTRRPPVGATGSAVLSTSAAVTQTLADQPPKDFSTPSMRMPLGAHVTSSEPGMTEVALTLGDVTSPDPTLNTELKAERGAHAGLTIAPDGAITTLRISPPPNADNMARAAVEQAFYQAIYSSVALPSEPVGVGATWRTEQHFTSAVELDQTMNVTLKARQGDVVTLDVQVNQSPTSPVWVMPGDTRKLNIDKYEMTGGGTVTLDLDAPLPTAADITVGGEQVFRVPDSDATIAQTLGNHTQWSAR